MSVSFCFQGLTTAIVGPTIIDLKELVMVNYEEITRVLVAKSVGFMVGSVLGRCIKRTIIYIILIYID